MEEIEVKRTKWTPIPKPPVEVIPPPDEKKIWEILREEKIPPTKRYVRKRRIH